jgi:hypothetical protein
VISAASEYAQDKLIRTPIAKVILILGHKMAIPVRCWDLRRGSPSRVTATLRPGSTPVDAKGALLLQ